MSDEPSASTARQGINADRRNDLPNRGTIEDRRKRNRRLFNKKREAFLADLMRTIDILVYAELSTIYYMEYEQSYRPVAIMLIITAVRFYAS